jgi:hypothetical protein
LGKALRMQKREEGQLRVKDAKLVYLKCKHKLF